MIQTYTIVLPRQVLTIPSYTFKSEVIVIVVTGGVHGAICLFGYAMRVKSVNGWGLLCCSVGYSHGRMYIHCPPRTGLLGRSDTQGRVGHSGAAR